MDSIMKGKGIIVCTIILILLIDFFVIALMTLLGGRILEGIIRFILECTILFFLYKGHNWAKWLIGILLTLGGSFSIFLALYRASIFNLVIGILFFLFGLGLLISKDVEAYIDYKNGKLKIDNIKENI